MTHLSLDDLGDVDAAAHDPHVAACERCRRAVADQRWVRDLLSGLDAPGAAPPDVVAGITAALRSLDRPAATVLPSGHSGAQRTGRRPARRWLALAAALVAVGAGGAAVQQLGSRGDDSSSGASAQIRTRAPSAADPRVVAQATGTAYGRQTLVAQVGALLARPTPTPAAGAGGPLTTPAGLRGCLRALDAGPALAVDLATYEGTPAAVIVLRAVGGGREVWVVGRDCREGADGTRYYTRLP